MLNLQYISISKWCVAGGCVLFGCYIMVVYLCLTKANGSNMLCVCQVCLWLCVCVSIAVLHVVRVAQAASFQAPLLLEFH